ncbi:MAG: HlyD family efflux transporter periplasmic adaptor subunit [Chloroflexota bacterium]
MIYRRNFPTGRGTAFHALTLSLLTILCLIGGTTVASAQSSELPEIVTEYVAQPTSLAITLRASSELEPVDRADLAFVNNAPVEAVYVAIGDRVQAGDVLATLDTSDLEAQLRRAEIALREAENNLAQMTAPPLEIDIRVAQAAIETATLSLENARRQGATAADIRIAELQIEQARNTLWQQQLNRDINESVGPEFRGPDPFAEEIETEGRLASAEIGIGVAEADLERTQTDGPNVGTVASAEESLLRAELALADLLEGPDELELQSAEIAVRDAALEVERLEAKLTQSQLIAPFDGVIADETLTPGAFPSRTEPPITVITTTGYRLTLAIDEGDIGDVAVGQSVTVTVDALPDETLTGMVDRVSNSPTLDSIVTYEVDVVLDSTDASVRMGMSTSAEIAINALDDAVVIPNGFISIDTVTGQAEVSVLMSDGTVEQRAVQTGQRTADETQIIAGVNAGETVVIVAEAGASDSPLPFDFGGQ